MVRKWGIKADHDFLTAQAVRRNESEEILTDTICFHCQQTIEKYLKALLVWKEIDFKKTHDLVYLQTLCVPFAPALRDFNVRSLSRFGTDIRYPDDFIMPSIEETDYALGVADQIRGLIRNQLSLIFEPS